ncbi:MAG TPA: KH domain-containing protein [Candidatus Saccharimonadales bacterium]|nr:KH domain-containing protein [Candidatus Saccharimonadales bacterium]
MAVSIDQQFIEYIVKSLVGNPDDVKVERRIDEKGVLLELSVNPEDLGRVIGKRGSTAQSLRTLLRALGTKNDARYNLKIVDTGPPPERRERSTENEEQPSATNSATADDKPSDKSSDDVVTDDAPTPQASDDVDMSDDEELPEKPSEETDHSDIISRTRKELDDLDDLEV